MTKFNMRLSLVLAAAAAIGAMSAFVKPAAAEIEYPWCAQLSEDGGGGSLNCGFVSQEQCLQTIRGIGGYCAENLRYPGPASNQTRRKPKRQH